MASYVDVPPLLTAEQMGVPDYAKAFNEGLNIYMNMNKAKHAESLAQREEEAKKYANMISQVQAQYAPQTAEYENILNKTKAQYAPQMAEAEYGLKKGQLENLPYEKQLLLAKIHKQLQGPAPTLSAVEKAEEALIRAEKVHGKKSEEYKRALEYVERLASGSKGINISYDANGKPIISIGGQGQKPGATSVDAQGNIISTPTTAAATNLQNRIIGEEMIEPYVQDILNTLPQFQDPKQKAALYAETLSNKYLGTDYPLPSQKAKGETALITISEGLVKSFGLNATKGNREAVEKILAPHEGESKITYPKRVKDQLINFVQSRLKAEKKLAGGFNVSPTGNQVVEFIRGPNGTLIPKQG